MTPDTAFGFADEMRVGLRGVVRRVWGRKGVKVVQKLQMVYENTYLFVAVDVVGGRLWWRWIGSMKSPHIAEAVEDVKGRSDVAALVWDGAWGHRAKMIAEVGLPTIVQPPYSPELNPVERVFQEVRRWTEGRVYESLEEKVEVVNRYLRELQSEPDRVRSLTAWSWIVRSARSLPAHFAALSA